MRMRLGILHDPEAQQRMHEREQKAVEERKRKAEAPTVRTAEEQKKHDEQKARDEKAEKDGEKKEEKKPKVKIRPLSDARAIELGANFFSEAFIFGVAVALLLVENWRSRNKESARRDEVKDRLTDLKAEVVRLRKERDLPEMEELNERLKKEKEPSWWNPAGWWRNTEPAAANDDEGVPGEVEGSGSKRIPRNVPGPPPEEAVKVSPQAQTKPTDSKPPERVDFVHAAKKER